MRICVDLDGVICRLKQQGESYADLLPVEGAVEKLRALREHGHTIIIHTARHMKTCSGNPSAAVAKIGRTTLDWLDLHGVPYDEIQFGKPWADVYLDDNAVRFSGWGAVAEDGSSLPVSAESMARRGRD